jgi:Domain of unknown function (DUF4349)
MRGFRTDGIATRTRWWVPAALGVAAVALLAACGSGGDNTSAASVAPARADSAGAGTGGGAAAGDAAAPGGISPSPAQNGAAAGGKSGDSAGGAGSGGGAQPEARITPGRALIKTADLTVRVDDVAANAAKLAGIAGRYDGVVYSDNRGGEGETATADIVLKVDPDRLEDAMAAIAGLGSEEHRSSNTQDVTEDVADVESRVATMKASIARVRAILARANTVGDVVSVEGELSRREAELESLQTRQRALAGQVAQATLTAHLLARKATVAPPPPPGPVHHGFIGGLSRGWDAFAGFITGLLTGVGAVLPFLIIVLPAAALLWARRRRTIPTPVPATAAPPAAGTTA